MMIGRERALGLVEKVLWMTQQYVQLAGMPKTYGTGDQFHSLDIHLIHCIGRDPGLNVTSLARRLGISKSAVSQALKKLEKRDLVRRFQVPENRKAIRFDLTERGRKAFEAHLNFHRMAEEPFVEELSSISAEEAGSMDRMLDLLMERAEHVRMLIVEQEGNDEEID